MLSSLVLSNGKQRFVTSISSNLDKNSIIYTVDYQYNLNLFFQKNCYAANADFLVE